LKILAHRRLRERARQQQEVPVFRSSPDSANSIRTPTPRRASHPNTELKYDDNMHAKGGRMAHYGTLRDYRFSDTDAVANDIRGSRLYGLDDEKLGKIDDVIFDHTTGNIRYVVVDTGGWLSSKKFIVPADRLRSSAEHEDDFRVDLTTQHIEGFPPYDESDVESEEKWGDYENRYRSKWETGPVMHRAETDRNITPTTAQMTKGSGATGPLNDDADTADLNPRGVSSSGISSRSPVPSGTSTASSMTSQSGVNRSVTPMRSDTGLGIEPQGPGRRWSSFEEKLRQRRSEIISGCVNCGSQPSSERLSERERKVS
jgi:sporulation protein YlmC with PRC-barrel domain